MAKTTKVRYSLNKNLAIFRIWDKLNVVSKSSDLYCNTEKRQYWWWPWICLHCLNMLLLCLNIHAALAFWLCASFPQHKSVQNIGQCYSTIINHIVNFSQLHGPLQDTLQEMSSVHILKCTAYFFYGFLFLCECSCWVIFIWHLF